MQGTHVYRPICMHTGKATHRHVHISTFIYKRRHAHMHPCTFAQTRIHTTWHILGRRMYMHTYLFKSAFMESHCKVEFQNLSHSFNIEGNNYFLGHERKPLKTTCWVCEKQGTCICLCKYASVLRCRLQFASAFHPPDWDFPYSVYWCIGRSKDENEDLVIFILEVLGMISVYMIP